MPALTRRKLAFRAVRPGVRARTFLISLGLIAVALLASEMVVERVLGERLVANLRADLEIGARLIAQRVAATPGALEDRAVTDTLADEMSRASGLRVTLVRADGAVAGDSEIAPRDLPATENHAARPEIAKALGSETASTIRHSATLGEHLLYVAVPVQRAGRTVGVARVALGTGHLDELSRELRRTLAFASLVSLAAAALLALGAANVLSRRLRELTAVAGEMAGGNLAARTRAEGRDEVAALGRALDQLAANLSHTLAALRGERDLLEGILSSMNEGVLCVGPDRRIALTNPALGAMLLLGPDAVGRSVLQAIRNADLNALLERTAGGVSGELELELAGLAVRRVLVRAVPLQAGRGGVLAVFVDLTELRRLETVRRDFVASASHELRSPLAAVRAAAETLATVKDDPQAAARFVEVIRRNAERLENLVNDMLELARIEAHEVRLDLEPVVLRPVAERLLAQHAHRAEAKEICLSCEIPAELAVLADRRALEHVLVNLLDNALKYCPAGARITVRAAAEEGRVIVAVSDTGPGIAPEHLPRLFERFYRVDPGRSRELGGTGLGLAIVKHLVEAMHGTVAAESRPGAGATFTFTLPQA